MQSAIQIEQKSDQSALSFFNQIYAIAKESKVNYEEAAKKLEKILEDYKVEALKKSPICVGAPLEQQDNNKLTPAGKLAFEGDEEAAEFLRIFGADAGAIGSGAARGRYREYAEYLRLNYCTGPLDTLIIAMGAAKGGDQDYAEELRLNNDIVADELTCSAIEGGHLEYAEYLRSEHGANVDIIAYATSALGYRDYTEYLRTDCNADIKTIVTGASGGGYIAYVEYLCRKKYYRDIAVIAERISSYQRIIKNEQEVLRSLAENDKFRIELNAELKKHTPFPELNELINKAERIATYRPKYNFDQCLALGNVELNIWYLQCFSLVKNNKLSFSSFISIGCYLSPMTFKDSQGFCVNRRFDIFQKLLVKEVNKHCASKRWLGLFGGDKKADAFSVACANAKTTEQLKPLLEKEMKQNGNEAKAQPQDNLFRDLVVRHYKRFN